MFTMIRKLLIILISVSLTACSVVMASKGNGVNPKDLGACKTRSCLIAAGAIPIDHTNSKQGKLASENFRATMPTGSAARAAMHGLLDVGTLGLWEVAGTPIEAVKGRKTGYVVAVKYEQDGSTIKHITFQF
ncbi:hypothetical protein BN59_01637 [Legionella massiliensis]|uniref:Lipoprotein n=1 Tax=Legionella massiliensis TaxID=1034943 RepID=A0A078KZW6_9GAMM|nr:hypothetical protein [Legionella massiliensis]CDZ77354.1 hypothetical protein BN59_01637 [Legionella massiliensis]CEE13092.1 hypothetical protein BN1094_01637 [Legionella massiliensis]